MANGGEDSRALQEFRRNFFGISREHAPMPESYLRELQRLVGAASAHLGVVVSSNERHAYWIDGRSLGVLSCQGVTDEDTVITGRICQLDTTVSVAIKVAVDYDRIENSSRSGRALTIRFPDDGLIGLDASPGVAEPAERDKAEAFIEHVLAALARR
jgi:hypothetical protein